MYKFIKANSMSHDKETVRIRLEFEFIAEIAFDESEEPISASIRKSGNLHFITVKILNQETGEFTQSEREIDEDFYAFVSAILSTMHSCGFVDLDSNKSPYSESLYFTLCHDSEFVNASAEVLFYLRISAHELPVHSKDIDLDGAKARKLKLDEDDSKRHTWINNEFGKRSYSKDDPTPFSIVEEYVKYEGNCYTNFTDIISLVRKRMEKIVKRNKPKKQ